MNQTYKIGDLESRTNEKPAASKRLAAGLKTPDYDFLTILASESQPQRRCRHTHDDEHDDVRRGDVFC